MRPAAQTLPAHVLHGPPPSRGDAPDLAVEQDHADEDREREHQQAAQRRVDELEHVVHVGAHQVDDLALLD